MEIALTTNCLQNLSLSKKENNNYLINISTSVKFGESSWKLDEIR
jgi:hypothetical protein